MAGPFFNLVDLGLAASASQLLQDWLTALQIAFPGYVPSQANLEYIQAQVFASHEADLAELCSSGGTELFRTYGTQLVGVPYQTGVAATAVVTITAGASSPTLTTLSSTIFSTGGPISNLPVVSLQNGVVAGAIVTDDGLGHTQTWTTTGANAGDTSIPVSPQTPSPTFPVGSAVSGTSVYTLPSLTDFNLDQLGFYNLVPCSIVAGTTQQVNLVAVQSGTAFNGAGSGGLISTILEFDWISTVTLTAAAAGGQDPEDDTHYINRLVSALQLQAPRPITAADFAGMAANFTPAANTDQQDVGRATAVDGYDPIKASYNNTRTVCVCVTDANGLALNNDTMYGYPTGTLAVPILTPPSATSGWGIEGWLRSLREINYLVYVVTPTYSAVYVAVTVKAATGFDATTVKAAVQTALLNYLSPPAWGLPVSTTAGWQNSTNVYLSVLINVIQQTGFVAEVVPGTLAVGLAPNPTNTTTDLALPGPVALPVSSTTTIPTSAITVT